ncbi:hypothetical protein LUZ61_011545 [Rhynchospora tenuis]|uniref:Transposase n=1 Tax=Rhynchospora tenuis TaxID=198213 RepID=A0AAD6A1D0_9POAL|nr:hypothetical protein LUZ61_011545 [Rhynchospora tenuis]
MRNHIDKKCRKIPRNKLEALQKLLQAKTGERDVLVPWTFNQVKSRKCLANMVIVHEYPFNCVTHHFFREFLCELQPSFKIPSRTTLRQDCMKIYEEEQVNLYEWFGQANIAYKKPQWDVSTRWNSTYLMLELVLELKPAFTRFAALDKKFPKILSDSQWSIMKELVKHLKIFYEATLKLSGTKYPTLNLFFSEFCEVYLSIKRMSSNEYPFIMNMGTQMHAKFDKYWSKGNSLLAIACVLDPRFKLDVVQYYMEELCPDECENILELCPDECENFISNLKGCMFDLYNEKKTDVSSSRTTSDRKAGLKDYLQGKKGMTGHKTELEEYLDTDRDDASLNDDFDILCWWKMKAPRFPVLAQLPRDILAVPISTVASESAFSSSGRVLSQVRSSLSDKSIEALLCAQDWLRASIADLIDVSYFYTYFDRT